MYLSAACFSAVFAEPRKFRFADCKSNGPLQADETCHNCMARLPEGGQSELKVNLTLGLEALVGGLGRSLRGFSRLRRRYLGLVVLVVAPIGLGGLGLCPGGWLSRGGGI
jgi:hypothetical protein